MTIACPVHRHIRLQDHDEPESGFFRVAHRIADRFGPEVAEKFLEAVDQVRDSVDLADVEAAVRAGDLAQVEAALGVKTLRSRLAEREAMQASFGGTFAATGQASADVLEDALGVAFSFDARDPRAIIFARSQTATLVTRIDADQRLAIQAIMGRAFSEGLPPRVSARFLHGIMGLRHDWAQAPMNLAAELRAGHAAAATARRLDAATKAQIRSRIGAGTVTDEFVDEVVETYEHALRRRRALDVARTEGLRSANAGQQESFVDAQRQGVLPQTARRLVVVTADDRLRETHAAVPDMNLDGVPIDEPFDTPFGALMYPPWEPLCRCGIALLPNPRQRGII